MSASDLILSTYIGARVVRGPDWQHQEQDDGEGHLGTVIKNQSDDLPDGCATVQWDCGLVMAYRAGLDGSHELRIYDNAPCGVRHWGVSCSECNVADIAGLRWQCSTCTDCNLCSRCYMSDLHDTSHVFKRYVDARSADAVAMPPRNGAARLQAAGLLPGAVVMRSDAFKGKKVLLWNDQDNGGKDVSGKILDVIDDSAIGCRNAVRVQWQRGPPSRIYPVGRDSIAYIQYRIGMSGDNFYPEHLPVLTVKTSTVEEQPDECKEIYEIGSRVWSDFGERKLKELGIFDPQMLEVRGRVGLVQRVTTKGEVIVEHFDPARQLTYMPDALCKATAFRVGDFLLVDEDEKFVRACQVSRVGWAESVRQMLGKVVQVIKVHGSGDLRVKYQSTETTLNPVCCSLVDKITDPQPLPSVNRISLSSVVST